MSWQSGTSFEPGKQMMENNDANWSGYIYYFNRITILIYPKEITLEFKQPIHGIQAMVLGIQESWDIAKKAEQSNTTHAYSQHSCTFSQSKLSVHSFDTPQSIQEKMCRYLMVRMTANVKGNHLCSISMKRWRIPISADSIKNSRSWNSQNIIQMRFNFPFAPYYYNTYRRIETNAFENIDIYMCKQMNQWLQNRENVKRINLILVYKSSILVWQQIAPKNINSFFFQTHFWTAIWLSAFHNSVSHLHV